ncbi:hypothetical protein [Moraxella catarrhalis]|uniref:hypothetical protein n=1 Tax=Moraxella catarrhalis TaxID=480 RepID=UPI0007E30508|nr:hypothetical protein [Moraxella catarrhalis]OAV33280.1 hypothetical protein AO368_0185 [Moraxella catarrhalis]
MPLPWLIGAAVVGIGAAILASDDDSDKKSSYRDDDDDEELERDRRRRERERREEREEISEQANEYFTSSYDDFLSPMLNVGICKTVSFSSSIDLDDDFDDYLESDIELFGLSSELDYEKLEIIFDDLDDMYGDFSEVVGSIAKAHHRLTGEYLSITKKFDKNLKLAYKINKTRHKIQDVLEDNDE